jgi:hypothetical protein
MTEIGTFRLFTSPSSLNSSSNLANSNKGQRIFYDRVEGNGCRVDLPPKKWTWTLYFNHPRHSVASIADLPAGSLVGLLPTASSPKGFLDAPQARSAVLKRSDPQA